MALALLRLEWFLSGGPPTRLNDDVLWLVDV